MYDGIFEDVERVKEVLVSHGHNSVDGTLVFELLEDLKVTDLVVKILLGKRLRSNSAPNSSFEDAASLPRFNDFYLPNTLGDSCSSDDLEVLQHDVVERVAESEAVDLTMDENQASPEKRDTNDKDEIQTRDSGEPVIDLTSEVRNVVKVEQECCANDDSKDILETKTEDAELNNSATDSEFEMDDYYSGNFIESGESDGKPSLPPSPALRISPNFVSRDNNEASNLEAADNRMEEMLEENNNDPNNNLEDIEVLEQNNGLATTTENLNIQKESIDERSSSPQPGCSKDSYYADTDFCMTDSGAASNGSQTFTVGKRPNIANIFEDEDFLVGNCVRLSDTKIGQDVFVIQKILPRYTKAKILSTVMENQEALNRVEIALWKLLSDEEPAPVYHAKRKQEYDNCPAPLKKILQDDSNRFKKIFPLCSRETPKVEATIHAAKTNLIRPAKLYIPDNKESIVKPAKLKIRSSEPVPHSVNALKQKSTVTLKPSRLQHLNVPNTLNTASDDTIELKNSETFEKYRTSVKVCKDMLRENKAAILKGYETGAIPKRLEQTTTSFPVKQENKSQDSTQSRAEKPAAAFRNSVRFEIPIFLTKEERGITDKLPQPTRVEVLEKPSTSNVQKTGAIPKNPSQVKEPIFTEKAMAKLKNCRPRINTKSSAETSTKLETPALLRSSEKVREVLVDYPEPGSSMNFELPVGRHFPKPDERGPRATSSDVQRRAESAIEFPTSVDVVADANPARIEEKEPLAARGLPPPPNAENMRHNELNEDFMLQFGDWVGDLQPRQQKMLDDIISELQPNEIRNNPNPDASAAPRLEPARSEKKEIQPPKELFNPLLSMFPDVDPNYIAELCVTAKLSNQGLESLVEILLINGVLRPRVVNPEPEPQDVNPDAQYENLQGIFPDAHPEYLRNIAEQYFKDPEAMKNFVQAKLENPDYPKMADYLKKIKITEQIRQYTVDFSAEKFVQIFPRPFTHFEDPKRVYRYNVIAFEFLKCQFRSNKVATILKAYKSPKHPHHLTLAAKSLELIGPDMKSKRPDKPLPTEDIPLLQEFAFIKHKTEIKEYITAERLRQKQEFKRLKANNELLECQCCYDAECMPSKCLTCSVGHIFCISCIKTGSATKIGEGQTQFPCFVECEGEFTLPVLQKVLEPTMFSILLRKRQEEEVKAAGLEGLVSCPFCHFASIPPPEDKVFKCLNPECMKETCRLCKDLNHVPLRCDEVTKGEEARHYLEERMTEALVRKCYRCSRPFFKDEGCNKMTCPCGATTCYICGEPVKDYRHFNGQGSDRTDLCPLWSDNNVLNAQTVRAVAEAAEKEILKKNPHLKIDAKALMPSVPQASRGPHQDIANAHVLPVQARRV